MSKPTKLSIMIIAHDQYWRTLYFSCPLFNEGEWHYNHEEGEVFVPTFAADDDRELINLPTLPLPPPARHLANCIINHRRIKQAMLSANHIDLAVAKKRHWDEILTCILEAAQIIYNRPLVVKVAKEKGRARPYQRTMLPSALDQPSKNVDEVALFTPKGMDDEELDRFRKLPTYCWLGYLARREGVDLATVINQTSSHRRQS
jgi:hypothetical protein